MVWKGESHLKCVLAFNLSAVAVYAVETDGAGRREKDQVRSERCNSASPGTLVSCVLVQRGDEESEKRETIAPAQLKCFYCVYSPLSTVSFTCSAFMGE